MEIFNNIAKQQSAQFDTGSVAQAQTAPKVQPIQEPTAKIQDQAQAEPKKLDTQEKVQDLVKELNASLNPFNTSLRFGFDNSSEDFYVSVIESQTNRLIRRFPAEQAADFLPKMQEVSGILFDEKG